MFNKVAKLIWQGVWLCGSAKKLKRVSDEEVEVLHEYDMRDNHFPGLTASHSLHCTVLQNPDYLFLLDAPFLNTSTKFLKHPQNTIVQVQFIFSVYKGCRMASAYLLCLPSLRSTDTLLSTILCSLFKVAHVKIYLLLHLKVLFVCLFAFIVISQSTPAGCL